MSSRPQFSPYPVIEDGDMSSDIISLPTIIQKLSMISYNVSWDGTTPVGSVSIQVSNDYSKNVDGSTKNEGTWTTLTIQYQGSSVTSVPVTGNTGNGFIDVTACAAYAMRLVYTATSGDGLLQVIINAKVA